MQSLIWVNLTWQFCYGLEICTINDRNIQPEMVSLKPHYEIAVIELYSRIENKMSGPFTAHAVRRFAKSH